MTNKEKAIQVYNELSRKCNSLYYGYVTDALLEMADWKDKQFQKYLEEVVRSEKLRYESSDADSEDYALGRCDMVEGILNSLFPKTE